MYLYVGNQLQWDKKNRKGWFIEKKYINFFSWQLARLWSKKYWSEPSALNLWNPGYPEYALYKKIEKFSTCQEQKLDSMGLRVLWEHSLDWDCKPVSCVKPFIIHNDNNNTNCSYLTQSVVKGAPDAISMLTSSACPFRDASSRRFPRSTREDFSFSFIIPICLLRHALEILTVHITIIICTIIIMII